MIEECSRNDQYVLKTGVKEVDTTTHTLYREYPLNIHYAEKGMMEKWWQSETHREKLDCV